MPLPISWAEAGKMVRDLNRRAFPEVSARNGRRWRGSGTTSATAPARAMIQARQALSVLDGPMPELWPQFEALKRVPLLVLRGEHSDILSAETVEEMRRRHPRFAA